MSSTFSLLENRLIIVNFDQKFVIAFFLTLAENVKILMKIVGKIHRTNV